MSIYAAIIVFTIGCIIGAFSIIIICVLLAGNKITHNLKNNEICIWESNYGFISDKYKRDTSCGYTFYDLHHAIPFKYCPYCGKKIKVVE